MSERKAPFDPDADFLKAVDIEAFQQYLGTYMDQKYLDHYTVTTFLLDMVYGLGTCLSDDYKFAGGFERFAKDLIPFLEERLGLDRE